MQQRVCLADSHIPPQLSATPHHAFDALQVFYTQHAIKHSSNLYIHSCIVRLACLGLGLYGACDACTESGAIVHLVGSPETFYWQLSGHPHGPSRSTSTSTHFLEARNLLSLPSRSSVVEQLCERGIPGVLIRLFRALAKHMGCSRGVEFPAR